MWHCETACVLNHFSHTRKVVTTYRCQPYIMNKKYTLHGTFSVHRQTEERLQTLSTKSNEKPTKLGLIKRRRAKLASLVLHSARQIIQIPVWELIYVMFTRHVSRVTFCAYTKCHSEAVLFVRNNYRRNGVYPTRFRIRKIKTKLRNHFSQKLSI